MPPSLSLRPRWWSSQECRSSSLLALVGWCHSKTHAHGSESGLQIDCFLTVGLSRRSYKEFVTLLWAPFVWLLHSSSSFFPPLSFFSAGVSCDACLKGNFRGRRFKCLICYDYDLCASCYESGATTTRHTTEHPMQCILTRVDYGKDLPHTHSSHLCHAMVVMFYDFTLAMISERTLPQRLLDLC